MPPEPATLWTNADYLIGHCSKEQVGHPLNMTHDDVVAASQPEEPALLAIDEIPAHILRRDIMKVYRQLGGADYLKRLAQADPAQFNKYLLKVLPQTVEADVTNHIRSIDGMTLEQIRELPTDQLKLHLLRAAKQGAIDVPAEPADSPESPG